MLKLPKVLYLTCFLWLFLSCSSSQTSSSSVTTQSYQRQSDRNYGQKSYIKDPAINRLIIPPEIGVMRARIGATASSFAEVAKLIEVNSEKVLKSINSQEGCSASIIDYHHPVELSGKKLLADKRNYSSHLQLEILISFAEMKDIKERIKQVNDCLQAIPEVTIQKPKEKISVYLTLSDVMPTIQNAGKYRQQLLKAKFSGLKEVANLSEPATQFSASDTRCTSKGIVKVVERSLSGIELDVDLDCYRLGNEVVVGETEPN